MVIDSSFSVTEELESELMALWVKFLNKADLTVDDDFFESGGDSLWQRNCFSRSSISSGSPFHRQFCLRRGPSAKRPNGSLENLRQSWR